MGCASRQIGECGRTGVCPRISGDVAERERKKKFADIVDHLKSAFASTGRHHRMGVRGYSENLLLDELNFLFLVSTRLDGGGKTSRVALCE